jgi:hypothetical protein
MTNHRALLATVLITALAAGGAVGAQLSFGGDLKLHLFDMTTGSSTLMSVDSLGNPVPVKYDTTDRWDMGFERAYLYFVVQITDQASLDIEPELIAQSGATPQLGMRIGDQRVANEATLGVAFNAAKLTLAIPWNLQVSGGILRPLFTEDYGDMKAFQEQNRYNKTGANYWLQAWHDMGIEVYRPFELKLGEQYISIPTYLYLLNGAPNYIEIPASDNNSNKMVMLHVAPEFWKVRVMGSYGVGKWDDAGKYNVMRYAVGLSAEFGPVWLRAEYMGGQWDSEMWQRSYEPFVIDTFAAKPFGYYAKLGVNIVPERLRFILAYDYAEHNFNGFLSVGDPAVKQQYTTVSGTLGWTVFTGSSVMLGVEKAMWKTSDGNVELDYLRPTLGWRTVF